MKNIYSLLLLSFFCFQGFAKSPSFSTPVAVANGATFGWTRPSIALTDDSLPVVLLNNKNTRDVYVSRWANTAFGQPVKITPAGVDAAMDNWMGPDIAAKGDDVYVVFKSWPEVDGFIYIVHSGDGGATFGDTVRVVESKETRFPVVAVMDDGNPVVMFMQFEAGLVKPEYVIAISKDKGKTFAQPVEVSDQAPGDVCDCCPAAIVTRGNTVVALYRNNDNNIRDAWIAVSSDGGQTFRFRRI